MAENYNHLKPWLEELCQKCDLPIYKLANRAGISRAIIYAWMSDRHRPDPENLLKVVQVFAAGTGRPSEELLAEALTKYTDNRRGRLPGTSA